MISVLNIGNNKKILNSKCTSCTDFEVFIWAFRGIITEYATQIQKYGLESCVKSIFYILVMNSTLVDDHSELLFFLWDKVKHQSFVFGSPDYAIQFYK